MSGYVIRFDFPMGHGSRGSASYFMVPKGQLDHPAPTLGACWVVPYIPPDFALLVFRTKSEAKAFARALDDRMTTEYKVSLGVYRAVPVAEYQMELMGAMR